MYPFKNTKTILGWLTAKIKSSWTNLAHKLWFAELCSNESQNWAWWHIFLKISLLLNMFSILKILDLFLDPEVWYLYLDIKTLTCICNTIKIIIGKTNRYWLIKNNYNQNHSCTKHKTIFCSVENFNINIKI